MKMLYRILANDVLELTNHIGVPAIGSFVVIVDTPDGSHREAWWENCYRHRINGPAGITDKPDGYHFEEWYQNGELHRIDGPAIIVDKPDGSRELQFRIEGKLVRKEYHEPLGPKPAR
jgi:hypothetical protein